MAHIEPEASQPLSPPLNARYWQPTGTIVVCIEGDLYKIDEPALSTKLTTLRSSEIGGFEVRLFPDNWKIQSKQFEALLLHIHQDKTLESSTSFEDIACILRITAPDRLDLSSIHSLARERLESLFPKDPTPCFKSDDAEEALTLAIKYNITSIQRQLYYTLVTTSDIGTDDHAEELHPLLDPSIVKRCKHLLASLIGHFAPILFTVSTGSHMACTDIFAENWMTLVIGPSLLDDGVSQPIETLQRIIDVDWISLGVCDECVSEKRVEWRGDMGVIWEKMNAWLHEA